jgi:hypothetical protein
MVWVMTQRIPKNRSFSALHWHLLDTFALITAKRQEEVTRSTQPPKVFDSVFETPQNFRIAEI